VGSNVHIKDGEGSKRAAGVTTRNALKVTTVPPAPGELVDTGEIENLASKRILTGYFLNGTSRDQKVDGSVTPVDFVVAADPGAIRTLLEVRFFMAAKGALISSSEGRAYSSSFSGGLTNGIRFFAFQAGGEVDLFVSPVKQLIDYYLYQSDLINDAGTYAPNTDILVVTVRLPEPVILVPSLTDKLVVRIQDNFATATDIDVHETTYFGYQESI
jgi:hypothetical protein